MLGVTWLCKQADPMQYQRQAAELLGLNQAQYREVQTNPGLRRGFSDLVGVLSASGGNVSDGRVQYHLYTLAGRRDALGNALRNNLYAKTQSQYYAASRLGAAPTSDPLMASPLGQSVYRGITGNQNWRTASGTGLISGPLRQYTTDQIGSRIAGKAWNNGQPAMGVRDYLSGGLGGMASMLPLALLSKKPWLWLLLGAAGGGLYQYGRGKGWWPGIGAANSTLDWGSGKLQQSGMNPQDLQPAAVTPSWSVQPTMPQNPTAKGIVAGHAVAGAGRQGLQGWRNAIGSKKPAQTAFPVDFSSVDTSIPDEAADALNAEAAIPVPKRITT